MSSHAVESKTLHVPRITQLDAGALDKEIASILKTEVGEILLYASPNFITQFEPELDAFLSLLIWKLSTYDNGATFGQSLLDLKMSKSSTRKRVLLAGILIGGKYAFSRWKYFARLLKFSEDSATCEQTIRWMETGFRIANLANRLAFLLKGRYPSIPERVLDVPPIPASDQHNRQIGYSYMTRELLWHSLIELLVFVLPLINYRAWYAKITTLFQPFPLAGLPKPPNFTVETTCAICNEKPTLPHHINCAHIFCAFCLKGNVAVNQSFLCPLCGARAKGSVEPIII